MNIGEGEGTPLEYLPYEGEALSINSYSILLLLELNSFHLN